jgi:hypothetical protein
MGREVVYERSRVQVEGDIAKRASRPADSKL